MRAATGEPGLNAGRLDEQQRNESAADLPRGHLVNHGVSHPHPVALPCRVSDEIARVELFARVVRDYSALAHQASSSPDSSPTEHSASVRASAHVNPLSC